MNKNDAQSNQKTKFLVSDTAVRSLPDRNELQKYLDHIRENDEIVEPYINECAVVGMENAPLFVPSFKEEHDVAADDEDIMDCCESYGQFLVFPTESKMVCMPSRYTAYAGICARAGLTGPTMKNLVPKPSVKVLSAQRRAAILSEAMQLYSDKCKILIRDGKVAAMHSKSYSWLKPEDVIPMFEEYLSQTWPDASYDSGEVSHEFLVLNYLLNDDVAEAGFKLLLQECGKTISGDVKAGIRVSTSDVGLSAVRFSAFYTVENVKINIGKPIEIIHDGGNTLETIKTNLPQIASTLQEAEDTIEELGNIHISHPSGCLQRICLDHKQIPYGTAKEFIDVLDKEFPNGCTAVDVYFTLNEIVETHHAKKPMSPTRYIDITEHVSRLMFLNYEKYDLPVIS